ncbi:MAG: carbohydrate binding family 9 domain-containing protein [Opitutae bacterium]|nr:carbohydrate binding family 9 domain-containing protein [Opitutae bacterium]
MFFSRLPHNWSPEKRPRHRAVSGYWSGMISRFALLATVLLPVTTRVSAQTPALALRPAAVAPKIDGVLSPGEWDAAAHSDAFRQITPLENTDPTERTEFWAAYDADNLYVAIRAHDREPAHIRAVNMQRDQDNDSDDLVWILFDPFHHQRDGYFFGLTAAGGKLDGLIQNKTESKFEWDGLWHGKVSRDAGGWSAEFAIPLKTLSFDPANDTWGFNLQRVIRRKQEKINWSGYTRAKGISSLPDAGELRGLTGLRQGRGLEFKPFASLTRHSDPLPDQHEVEFKPGFDLVWHVTPSLAATFTVNTDFADAEVDERQVNLTRFPLFFPEKRSFFTQDASLFTFGGLRTDPLPFFSRRIGLAADFTPVDLLGGAKLTGRLGPVTLGVLDVQTDRHSGVPSRNLFVGRASVQVLAESNAGVIVTHGDPRAGGDNTLVGFDFNYASSHLPGNRAIEAHAWVQATDSTLAGGKGIASAVAVNYPNEPFGFTYYAGSYGSHYDPALGSVQRTGINSYFLQTRYTWRPDRFGIRRIQAMEYSDISTSLRGRALSEAHQIPYVEIEAHSGDLVKLLLEEHHERLDAPFAISPGVLLPTGDHRWLLFQADWLSSPARPVSAGLTWAGGGFYTGHRTRYGAQFNWRPSGHLEFTSKFDLQSIRLPEGNFAVRLATARVAYLFTPGLQLSLLGQYDNFSNQLGANFRVKWIVQPGNEFYFVVNQGYDATDGQLRPTRNDTSLKGVWTFRF